MASKRLAQIGAACVACGCCLKVCPTGALSIDRGVRAVVNPAVCVGCGKCAAECPASTITLLAREARV